MSTSADVNTELYERFIRDLETIVNIDCDSSDRAGLERVLSFFRDRFNRLGWMAERREFSAGNNPCLEIRNPVGASGVRPFDLLCIGHMDTVFAPGTAADRPFTISENRALGPGVSDMKGGLLTVLYAMETMQSSGLADRLSIGIAFNSDEEIGSVESRPWLEAQARESRRVFLFEPCRPGRKVVLQRKGGADFRITAQGRSSHAGADPEKGANAVIELAHQMLAAQALADPDQGTTVNPTVCRGGEKVNVIPDLAEAFVDVRIQTRAEALRVEAALKKLSERVQTPGVQVTVAGSIVRFPMEPSTDTLLLWKQLQAAAAKLGLDIGWVSTGGVSDGNWTAAVGTPTIDGMGTVGANAHSPEEYIELDSIVPSVQIFTTLCGMLAEERE